jgi:transposase
MAVMYPVGYVLQQDNVTPHTAKTKWWLNNRGIEALEGPPCFPDLNPIENLWQIIKDSLEKMDPGLINEWNRNIRKIWDSNDFNFWSL